MKHQRDGVTYFSNTGKFFHGDREVGHHDVEGYLRIWFNCKLVKAHRLAYLIVTGKWPDGHMDHKNLVRDDNRWENLRVATQTENNRQRRGWSKSGYKGVYYDKKSIVAKIRFNKKLIKLGKFPDEISAAKAYDEKVKELYGDFKKLNFG